MLMRVGRSPRGRLAVSVGLAIVTTTILAAAGRSLLDAGWPLAHGNPALVAAAGLLFVLAYGFKAYGWRRLFRADERPGPLALAAAGGGASIMGVVLPGRFDEVVRIAIVRRFPGCPVCVRGLCLSLVTLGLIEAVALSPFAIAAAFFPGSSAAVRAGFAVLGIGGIAAAALAAQALMIFSGAAIFLTAIAWRTSVHAAVPARSRGTPGSHVTLIEAGSDRLSERVRRSL